MQTINLTDDMLDHLRLVQGNDIQDKISHLIETHIALQLRECEELLLKFQAKYGMDFETFAQAWEHGEVADRHSHQVERDYMEWEGFISERRKLLKALRSIRSYRER